MSDTQPLPGFFARIGLAMQVLFDAQAAAKVAAPSSSSSSTSPALPAPVTTEKVVEKVIEKTRIDPTAGALQMLALLQREGRLIDFLQEDMTGAADADVGAAARVVQAGCKKALSQVVKLTPADARGEGNAVVVDKGFDPARVRLVGNVTGQPPFRGTLVHAGWIATDVNLPARSADVDAGVVAPAEVELP